MRLKRGLGSLMVVTVLALIATSTSTAQAPYTLVGVYPGGAVFGVPDFGQLDRMAGWQHKRNAIVNLFAGDAASASAYMDTAWNTYGSVPLLSYQPQGTNAERAAGVFDGTDTLPLIQAVKAFVAGPDAALNTGDDRRVYLRYAWEPGVRNHAHSPCNGIGAGTGSDYVAAWRRAHDLFTAHGLGPSQVQSVYSVAPGQSCSQGSIDNTYPGDPYVDWTGVDTYSRCGSALGAAKTTVDALRLKAPSKPVGVNEAGISSLIGNLSKNAQIEQYWAFIYNYDIRMSIWFNYNHGSESACSSFRKPWKVFGPAGEPHGDEIFSSGGRNFRAFSAYRLGVEESWVKGSNPTAPRLIGNARFKGQ